MPAKKTHTQFIEECKTFEPRGIYLIGDQQYQGALYKYKWKCIHDDTEWEAPLARIANGNGCPTCGRLKTIKAKTVDLPSFLSRIAEHNNTNPANTIEYVDGYTASTKSCKFRCGVCQHEWDTVPSSIFSGGHGCPECGKMRTLDSIKIDEREALDLLAQYNSSNVPKVELDGQYMGYSVRTGLKCSNGHGWNGVLNMLINQNTSCPVCTLDDYISLDQVTTDVRFRDGSLTILTKDNNLRRRTDLLIECHRGHLYSASYNDIMAGHTCPHCASSGLYSQDQFINLVRKHTPNVNVTGIFVSMDQPIGAVCTICNHTWKSTAKHLASGVGCPTCEWRNTHMKPAEQWIRTIEHSLGYSILRQSPTVETDAYDPATDTSYLFYSDYWFGNPIKYSGIDINPHMNISYGNLHSVTVDYPAKLPGKLVTIWESDFNTQIAQRFLGFVLSCLPGSPFVLRSDSEHVVLDYPDTVIIVININSPPDSDDRQKWNRMKNQYVGKSVYVLFSDELTTNSELVNRKLMHYNNVDVAPTIHARKCDIRTVDVASKNKLLDAHHVQQHDNAVLAYGAFYNDQLVAVMTFTSPRVALGAKGSREQYDGVWELSRFCTDTSYRIPGIASRLLTAFKRENQWTEIYSYADKRWSVGNMYHKLGFDLVADNPPVYHYVIDGKRKHRWNYRKDVLRETLSNYAHHKTEYQMMQEAGFWRVWDCGTLKFSIKQ